MKTIELTKKEYVAPKSKCVEIEEELLLQDSYGEASTASIMMLSDESETSGALQSYGSDSKDRGIFDFGFDE